MWRNRAMAMERPSREHFGIGVGTFRRISRSRRDGRWRRRRRRRSSGRHKPSREMFDTLASTLSQGTTSLNSDGELVIRSALSRYVLWSIVGLLAVVVARLLWRKRRLRPFSVGSYFLAIIALVVVVPGFLNETIRVSPTKVSWRGG